MMNTFWILVVALVAVIVAVWALSPWRHQLWSGRGQPLTAEQRYWRSLKDDKRFIGLLSAAGPGCRPEDPATDEEADEAEEEPRK
jgi:hypothetical protein